MLVGFTLVAILFGGARLLGNFGTVPYQVTVCSYFEFIPAVQKETLFKDFFQY